MAIATALRKRLAEAGNKMTEIRASYESSSDAMLFLHWLLSALSVFAAAYLVPGVRVSGIWAALIAALVIGLVNALIRPILLVLTLPINIVTLGLFTLVVNALMFWLASSVVKGFDVADFKAAFLGALVFWLVSWAANAVFGTKGCPNRRYRISGKRPMSLGAFSILMAQGRRGPLRAEPAGSRPIPTDRGANRHVRSEQTVQGNGTIRNVGRRKMSTPCSGHHQHHATVPFSDEQKRLMRAESRAQRAYARFARWIPGVSISRCAAASSASLGSSAFSGSITGTATKSRHSLDGLSGSPGGAWGDRFAGAGAQGL